VAQPDHADRSQHQPLPVAMRGKVPIQQVGDLHPFQLCQQDRDIVNSFYGERFSFVHGVSVGSILPTVQQNVRIVSSYGTTTLNGA
jgi:hypothetical protein